MKMSKMFMATAVVMLAAWSLANAVDGPLLGSPRGGAQALASADYGGVWYSTSAFVFSGTGVNYSTITIPTVVGTFNRGVFYGVIFSSGTTSDFVDVYDSTSADKGKNDGAFARLYNVGASTGGAGSTAFGFSGPPKPVRFSKGLVMKASRADFNMLTGLYYVEPPRQ